MDTVWVAAITAEIRAWVKTKALSANAAVPFLAFNASRDDCDHQVFQPGVSFHRIRAFPNPASGTWYGYTVALQRAFYAR
jgi:hypothetical protein